jgi:hypothetical protein
MRDNATGFKIIRHGFAQGSRKRRVKRLAPNRLLPKGFGDGHTSH